MRQITEPNLKILDKVAKKFKVIRRSDTSQPGKQFWSGKKNGKTGCLVVGTLSALWERERIRFDFNSWLGFVKNFNFFSMPDCISKKKLLAAS